VPVCAPVRDTRLASDVYGLITVIGEGARAKPTRTVILSGTSDSGVSATGFFAPSQHEGLVGSVSHREQRSFRRPRVVIQCQVRALDHLQQYSRVILPALVEALRTVFGYAFREGRPLAVLVLGGLQKSV
jgi:hypothetical protein